MGYERKAKLHVLGINRISSNRHHPQIHVVATARKHGTLTHVQMISDNGHYTSARTVCVVQVVPMADSRTERLRVLLTVSSNRHCLTRMYLIQPVVGVSGLSKEINTALK